MCREHRNVYRDHKWPLGYTCAILAEAGERGGGAEWHQASPGLLARPRPCLRSKAMPMQIQCQQTKGKDLTAGPL